MERPTQEGEKREYAQASLETSFELREENKKRSIGMKAITDMLRVMRDSIVISPNEQITNIETEEQLEAYVNTCEENLVSDHIDDHVLDVSGMDDQNTIGASPPSSATSTSSSEVPTDPQPSTFSTQTVTDLQPITSSSNVLTRQHELIN
ncbi:hypothetical protein QE152_g24641 [Popillia japonica]|uniref:Uncharacterized protein n=1 Tax=Popillia japonica TaxID=7064 RepID=A0AAW1K4W2_POPJA